MATTRALAVTPLTPYLVAEVTGVDVTERQWDVVTWDNRAVLHRGRPWDAARHPRVMRRTTVAGEGPTTAPPFTARTPVWEGIIPEGVGA